MSVTLFSITFSIIIFGMLFLLLASIQSLPTVKAGKVTTLCKETNWVLGKIPSKLSINGVKVDAREDLKMLVCGNSMKNYHIYNGQRIYVKPMTDEEKIHIHSFPVLVFNIVDGLKGDAKYKLRKFVGYVMNDDFRELYEAYQDRIKVSLETFTEQCTPKYNKLREKYSEQLVLSETYDEDKNIVLYSLHPVSTILGKVEYAI